jgi:ThiF family
VEAEDRFARFGLIEWWEQARLSAARVVVIGAGALGNEVIKNLALLGVGRLVVVDLDAVETSNLSRAVLFRAADAGQPKAGAAVGAARALYPAMLGVGLARDVVHGIGMGLFRWAEAAPREPIAAQPLPVEAAAPSTPPAIQETTGTPARFRLYTPSQVLAASLLGSALCGCWLLARNFRRFGDGKESTAVLIAGLVATAVQFALVMIPVPGVSTPSISWLPAVVAVALFQYANRVQGSRITEHLAAGGRRESWWKTIGIALLFVLGLLPLGMLVNVIVAARAAG